MCSISNTHKQEKEEGREVNGQWSWTGGLVGPVANSCETGRSVWHLEMRDFVLYPKYDYQCDMFVVKGISHNEKKENNDKDKREKVKIKVIILFASKTGTSEGVAQELARKIRALKPKLLNINHRKII